MALRTWVLLGVITGALSQGWFHLPQRPSAFGDLTADERAALLEVDASVAASPGALGVNPDFGQLLREHGDENDTAVAAYTPAEWGSSPAVGVQLLNSTPSDSFGAEVVRTDHGLYPATLYRFRVAWKLQDRPRRFALMVMEMIEDYRPYLGQLVPHVSPLLREFRRQGLPVFFTNWVRRPNDGLYGAFDRGYGFKGLKSHTNPVYIYAANGAEPMKELMPTEEELKMGHFIKSTHDNKFEDLGADGRSILSDKLKDLGVDTLVLTGGWTDACILLTASAAVDAKNLDVVIVRDAVGTATELQQAALEILQAETRVEGSDAFLHYLRAHAGDASYLARPLQGPAGIVLKTEAATAAQTVMAGVPPAAAVGGVIAVAAISGALGAAATWAVARRRWRRAEAPWCYGLQPDTAQV